MNEIGEKFLPIGTVVMLKGAEKRIMITGFCAIENENPDKIWDYSACMYPEGLLSSEQTFLFDHEQIEEIYYLGLVEEEQETFAKALKEAVNNLQNNNEDNNKEN